LSDISNFAREALDARLFSLGGNPFTLGSLLAALIGLVALLVFARWLRRLISERLLARGHLDVSTRETVSALTQYVVLGIGIVTILNIVGIQLSSFTVLAGAFGVGVGFGLQNIFSNFISGLIVMFERPIKIGDHIVLAGVDGDVAYIGMRATTLRTAQGSMVIVPNQAIITNNVTNWDHIGSSAISLQFRMAGAVPDDEALLLRVVRANRDVQKLPEPMVYVAAVDHAAHLMEVHFSVQGDATRRLAVVSAINAAVLAELAISGGKLAPLQTSRAP
jgi:small-conductance mechanosensitive channel